MKAATKRLFQKRKRYLEHLIIKSGGSRSRDELIDLFWGKDSFPLIVVDNYIVKFRKWMRIRLVK